MIRILHEARDTTLPGAHGDADSLWLDRSELERATGWTWKAEGLCRDDRCIPWPQYAGDPPAAGDRLDVAAIWRCVGWPVVRDAASQLWVLGEGAARRAYALTCLEAPDFELPDLHGRLHRLSDHRGRRVFLATWASW